jgi:hypothetical protein
MDQATVELLTRYYRQIKLDTADIEAQLATAGRNQNYLNTQLSAAQSFFDGMSDAATTLSTSLRDSVQSLSKGDANTKRVLSSFRSLEGVASKFKYDMLDYSTMSEKEIKRNITKIKQEKDLLSTMLLQKQVTGITAAEAESVISQSEELYKLAKERLKEEKKIQKQLGLTGAAIDGIVGALGKIGINNTFFSDMKEDMRDAAKSGGALKVVTTAVSGLAKGIGQALTDPLTVITFLLAQANKADKQTTALAKSMMQTKGEAMQTREEFVGMANAAGDAFINTDKLIEANASLGKQLGFNKVFSQDMNQTFVDLTKKIGLSEEAAGGLARVSLATGRTLKSTEQTIAGITSKISAQNGIQLDGKEILEESGKISGQLLANFKGNPAAIAEAVAQTKVLGTTLEQTKNQASKLLDFESSIGSQLKAELLTGQQLNLERARAAALQGDQVTVAKELTNQNINFNKFSKMNVIQQNALAESLGLSSDQLSDQLLKQEAIGKSRSEIVALGGEEAAKRLEALAAQDKFNAAVEKLKDLFGNLVGGPLGTILDVLSDAVGLVGKLISGIQSILGNTLMKGVLGAAAGFAVGGPMGALIGGVAGLASGVMSSADDMVGYGARTLTTPTGTVALNNNDTVIAGTNLFKGDDVMSFPKGKLNLGGGNNGKLEELMSTLIDVTKSTKIGVNLDGRAVGTGIVRATYQSA